MQSERDKVLQEAILAYEHIFGARPDIAVFAPGRVNLIGDHVDYCGGLVLPFAIPFVTVIVGSKLSHYTNSDISNTNDNMIFSQIHSTHSAGELVRFQLTKDSDVRTPHWSNYVKGTLAQYVDDLPSSSQTMAVNMSIASNVPIGSGLSSSAALEVASALFIESITRKSVDCVERAKRCQRADWAMGIPCGLMDQFISSAGRAGHCILLDCRSASLSLYPLTS